MIKKNDHSLTHALRVAFIALKLADELPLEDKLRLLIAAIIHDVGRINNSNDTQHGARSMEAAQAIGLNDPIISDLVTYHCRGDRSARKLSAHSQALLKIFKDADALDRVRTNDLNEDYLRLPQSKDLIPLARNLLKVTMENL